MFFENEQQIKRCIMGEMIDRLAFAVNEVQEKEVVEAVFNGKTWRSFVGTTSINIIKHTKGRCFEDVDLILCRVPKGIKPLLTEGLNDHSPERMRDIWIEFSKRR